jgi:putative hydrolase of the HAD superfamily
MRAPPRAVSFDAGQTLVELDTELLVERLAERGVVLDARRVEAAQPTAYRAYDTRAAREGHPWRAFMATLLEHAGIEGASAAELAAWLFTEQPRRNLWRRTIPGMVDLCRELRAAGVPVGIISNSEGRLVELLDEIGILDLFQVVADSGRLGIEKPDPRIFEWFSSEIGVPLGEIVHVGDSPTADIDAAIAVGMHAIGFDTGVRSGVVMAEHVAVATDAASLRRELARIGLEGLSGASS